MSQFPFSLVSPERELFAGDVDAVVIPGTEGIFEVRAGHAPLMATISPGMLEVHQGGKSHKTYVRGGFADISPTGLTVLAEHAVGESDLKGDVLSGERDQAKAVLGDDGADADAKLQAQRAVDALSKY